MKPIKVIQVYSFEELTPKQQEKCIEKHRDINIDMGNDFLSEDMQEEAVRLMEKAGYKDIEINVCYSLSYCQGDGVSIEGTFTKNKRAYTAEISNAMNYVHKYMMDIILSDGDGDGTESKIQTEKVRGICDKLEKHGYNIIEMQQSEEMVADTLIMNEWNFIPELDYEII